MPRQGISQSVMCVYQLGANYHNFNMQSSGQLYLAPLSPIPPNLGGVVLVVFNSLLKF